MTKLKNKNRPLLEILFKNFSDYFLKPKLSKTFDVYFEKILITETKKFPKFFSEYLEFDLVYIIHKNRRPERKKVHSKVKLLEAFLTPELKRKSIIKTQNKGYIKTIKKSHKKRKRRLKTAKGNSI